MAKIEDFAADEPRSITDGPFGSNLKTAHYTEQGPRVIRLQNIGDGRFIDEPAHISEKHYDKLKAHSAEAGDVIVASLGNELPRACIVPSWLGPAIVKADCIRLRPAEDVDGRYVMHMLNAPQSRDAVKDMIHGVGRPRLGLRVIRNIEIPLAPLDEQERIVEAIEEQLSRLDAGVESLRRANHNLIRIRASVLEEAVQGAIGGASLGRSSWPMVPLPTVLEGLRYGTSTKCSHDGDGKPVLRIPNVRDGHIVLNDLKSSIDPVVDLSRVTVEEGDVLFIRTNGSRDLIGRVGVVTKEAHGMAFASYLIGGRPSPELDGRFLWIVLSSPRWRRRIEGLAATSAGQYNISASSLNAIQIPLPRMQDQQEIVAEVDRQSSILGVVAGAIDTAKARAHGLRRSVLREAFAGRLLRAEASLDLANA